MTKQGQKLQERIREYNTMQVEDRKNLPNLLEMIKLAQEGNKEVFDKYFYGYKVIEKFPYDGKIKSYEVNKVRFWDKPLDTFLKNIKKRYTKNTAIGEKNAFSGHKITYKVNISNFEESEIDQLFYEFMLELIEKIELDNFIKDTEAKTLNAIRKYIRMGFENYLKKLRNESVGLERVRVNGELYYVKNKQEEVFFEDIFVGQDDEGEQIHFLDIVSHEDVYGSSFSEEDLIFTPKKFIEENLEEVLTKNQFEKYQLLLEYVKEHGIESILNKHTGKIIKSRVQKIIYPDKVFKNNVERVDSLVKIMNQRMERALDKAGIDYVSLDEEISKHQDNSDNKNGEVVVFTGGFTEEEVERYFQQHLESILRAYMEGRLTFDKGSEGMLPSDDRLEEFPFDVYDRFVKASRKERLQIIEEYHNKDKFKLRAGKKEIKKKHYSNNLEEKNNRYITPDELRDIRKSK